MMKSENALKEIVQLFIDLMNMPKQLMDENQQSSVTQELGRLFPSIRGGGRRSESSEIRIGTGESSASATDTNNTNFATHFTTKLTVEKVWGSKTTSKKA